jgi:hypothetical protein
MNLFPVEDSTERFLLCYTNGYLATIKSHHLSMNLAHAQFQSLGKSNFFRTFIPRPLCISSSFSPLSNIPSQSLLFDHTTIIPLSFLRPRLYVEVV